jgi:site-specific DNA recombinase
MLRLAAYARVSTGEQSSTDAQLETLIPLAARLGGSIVMSEVDVQTGFDVGRRGYQRILEAARRHDIDGVLVYKLDRFGRDHAESIATVQQLERMGVRVFSATEPVDDPFVRDLILLLANREVRVLSERVRMVQTAKSKEGQWQSRPPAGYLIQTVGEGKDAFKSLVPDPLRAPLVRQLFEAAVTPDAHGNFPTVRELRDLSHAIGLTSSTGREFTRGHVHKLLRNPVYQGDVYRDRQANGKFTGRRNRPKEDWTIARDAHPAIVDRETFSRVQAIFDQHRRVLGDARKTQWFLTSLIYCGECGARMYGGGTGTKTKGGNENFSYRCMRSQEYGNCSQRAIGGRTVDRYVKAEMSRFVVTPDVRRLAEAMVREKEKERETEANAQRRSLVRARAQHEKERRERAAEYLKRGKGVVPYEVYLQLEAENVQAIAIIDRTLATLAEVKPLDISGELAMLEAARWDLVEEDDPIWRGAAVLLVERVTVKKGPVKGKPLVEITWSPAAAVIRQAVGLAV